MKAISAMVARTSMDLAITASCIIIIVAFRASSLIAKIVVFTVLSLVALSLF